MKTVMHSLFVVIADQQPAKNNEEKRKNWNDLRNKNGIVSILINYYSKKSEFPLRASFQIFLITLGI